MRGCELFDFSSAHIPIPSQYVLNTMRHGLIASATTRILAWSHETRQHQVIEDGDVDVGSAPATRPATPNATPTVQYVNLRNSAISRTPLSFSLAFYTSCELSTCSAAVCAVNIPSPNAPRAAFLHPPTPRQQFERRPHISIEHRPTCHKPIHSPSHAEDTVRSARTRSFVGLRCSDSEYTALC